MHDANIAPGVRTFRRQGPPPPATPDALRELQERLTRSRQAEPGAPSLAEGGEKEYHQHPAPGASHAAWAQYYRALGLRLVPLAPGKKAPSLLRWGEADTDPSHWQTHPQDGFGVVLGPSRLCSLDLDDLPSSRTLFESLGMDWDGLRAGAVEIIGNPTRLRIAYRAPDGVSLSRRTLAWPAPEGEGKATIFELRGGDGFQDVWPPSLHPNGHPYQFKTAPWQIERLRELPPALLEIWSDWESWRPVLEAACPWVKPQEPPARVWGRTETSGESVISLFNEAHDAGALLEARGYKPVGRNRWICPNSTTGLAGVVRLPESGRIWSHHGSDPLAASGRSHDAFSLYAELEHGGDLKAAVKAAARLLGLPQTGHKAESVAEEGAPSVGLHKDPVKPIEGWRLVPVSELLTNPEPLQWLVRDYLQPDTLNLLFGDPVAGKSLLAIDWAASVATGRAWLGHAPTPAPVVYLAGEGFFGIKRRLFAWGLARDCLEELRAAPLVVSSAGAALTDDAHVDLVASAIDTIAAEQGQPGLIVIDTLARNFGAADENSAADVGLFVRAADYLRTRYQAAVLVVHHSGHGDKGRSRGSSAIRGAVDAEFCLSADALGVRTLTATKTKDAPPPDPLGFTLRVIDLPWVTAEGEPETSVVLQVAPSEGDTHRRRKAPPSVSLAFESLLACLDEAGAQPPDAWQPPSKTGPRPVLVASLEAWRVEFLARHTGDSDETKGRAFRRAREQLTGAGAVAVWRDVYWPRPDVAPWPDLAAMLKAASICRAANQAASGHSPDIRRTFSSCPDTDKERTLSGQEAGCPDMSGHTPKGVSVCPPCPPVRPVLPSEKAPEHPSQAESLEVLI